jgi:hypothetical protein
MNNVFNPSQCCSSKKSRNYNRFGALSYCTGVFHNELLRPFSLVPSSDVFVSYLHIVLLEWLLNMMHDLSPNDLLLSAKFNSLFTHELYCYIYQPKMHCADYIKASHNPRIKNTEPDKPEFDDYNITMVNPRVVANPFTKDDNYMRRNTANTRWVADSEHAKVGPSKNVQYVTPRSQHVSRKASVFDSISPKAHTLVLPQDKAKPLPPSPPESYKNVARRGSPVSPISPVDFTSSEQNRKHSSFHKEARAKIERVLVEGSYQGRRSTHSMVSRCQGHLQRRSQRRRPEGMESVPEDAKGETQGC